MTGYEPASHESYGCGLVQVWFNAAGIRFRCVLMRPWRNRPSLRNPNRKGAGAHRLSPAYPWAAAGKTRAADFNRQMGFPMIRSTLRPLALTLILAASVQAVPSFAADAPAPAAVAAAQTEAAAAQQPLRKLAPLPLDAPPPKPYEVPAKGIKDYIRAAVTNPARLPNSVAHDAYRKPAELLQFANIKPGQRIVEISAYGNYWSPMLSDIIGPKGELWMFDALFAEPYKPYHEQFIATHPNAKYQNVDLNKFEPPKGVDVLWCVGCFHELLLTGVELSAFHAKVYKAMKPGGTYIVSFFNSKDGRETNDTGALHRLDPAAVKAIITSNGFTFYQEERMYRNNDDKKDTKVFTEAEGDLADRTVYMFRK
jgi:predicted methyltransferase